MKRDGESDRLSLEYAAKMAETRMRPRFTRFLDPADLAEAKSVLQGRTLDFVSWGGYEGAERQIGCFCPAGETPEPEEFPVVCLRSAYNSRFASISHRDVLGAYMALGLTRNCLGDIIVGDTDVFLFVEKASAPYIEEQFESAGRVHLAFRQTDPAGMLPEPKGSYFRAVIPSLRLDAAVAAAFKTSRTKAAEWIRAGGVKVDHLVCEKTDHGVAAGTLLSVRGQGRARLTSVDGTTRKDRIGVTFFRFE
ncbi:MAG: hypothetical protein IJ573_08460 [Clostridia bacterium]|nr:hypothetical protein [Clostridia bacterium]